MNPLQKAKNTKFKNNIIHFPATFSKLWAVMEHNCANHL